MESDGGGNGASGAAGGHVLVAVLLSARLSKYCLYNPHARKPLSLQSAILFDLG